MSSQSLKASHKCLCSQNSCLLFKPPHHILETIPDDAAGEPSTWSIGKNRKLQSLIAAARFTISSDVCAADRLTRSLQHAITCVPSCLVDAYCTTHTYPKAHAAGLCPGQHMCCLTGCKSYAAHATLHDRGYQHGAWPYYQVQ